MIPDFIYALNLEKITVHKNTILVKEGEPCRFLYFILSGCTKLSFLYRKKELITYFYWEGDCVVLANSLLFEQPSPLSLQAIEWCELLVMNKEQCKALLQTNTPFIHWFYRTALEIEHNNAQHLQRVISNSGQVKYQTLAKEHPGWIIRFPSFMIAAYMGISITGLKRVMAIERGEDKEIET